MMSILVCVTEVMKLFDLWVRNAYEHVAMLKTLYWVETLKVDNSGFLKKNISIGSGLPAAPKLHKPLG